MYKKVIQKLKALLQWFALLELQEHPHWCDNRECYHRGVCWYCKGIRCAGVERKNCPNCVASNPKTCKGRCGKYALDCSCGYGRE